MTGSFAGVFPPCTERIAESGLSPGSKPGILVIDEYDPCGGQHNIIRYGIDNHAVGCQDDRLAAVQVRASHAANQLPLIFVA